MCRRHRTFKGNIERHFMESAKSINETQLNYTAEIEVSTVLTSLDWLLTEIHFKIVVECEILYEIGIHI